MVFKGSSAYLERIQSTCDNIVDILESLERIDSEAMRQIKSGNLQALGDEEHFNIRSYRIVSKKNTLKLCHLSGTGEIREEV